MNHASEETFARWRLDAVDADAMVEWVRLLRDDNPIHVDPDAAAALGFGHRTVNPGPANLAYALNMLMASRPGYYPVEIHARFLDNIYSGEAVEVTGKAAPHDGAVQAQVTVPARNTVALELSARLAPKETLP